MAARVMLAGRLTPVSFQPALLRTCSNWPSVRSIELKATIIYRSRSSVTLYTPKIFRITYRHVHIEGHQVVNAPVRKQRFRGFCRRRARRKAATVRNAASVGEDSFHKNKLRVRLGCSSQGFENSNAVFVRPVMRNMFHEEDRSISLWLRGKEVVRCISSYIRPIDQLCKRVSYLQTLRGPIPVVQAVRFSRSAIVR